MDGSKDIVAISVIIPAYNAGLFLDTTINSIQKQTFKNFELIIVDDGSIDNTKEICNQRKNDDIRIKYYYQENSGMSSARETGYKHISTTSKYICFMDADDIISPSFFEVLYNNASNKDIVIACFKDAGDDEIKGYSWDEQEYETIMTCGKDLFDMSQKYPISNAMWGCFFSRDFFNKMEKIFLDKKQIFPNNYFNDSFCIPRLWYSAQSVVIIKKVMLLHRISPYCDSRQLTLSSLQYELCEVHRDLLDFLAEKKLYSVYKSKIHSYYLTILKNWYLAYINQKQNYQMKLYALEMKRVYKSDYNLLKRAEIRGYKDVLIHFVIKFFKISPILWKLIIGDYVYKVKYKR